MIIAFDLTNKKSFESVQTWISSIYRLAPDSALPKVLVGNKVDLAEGGDRVVERSEARKLAEDHGIVYFETSAKENINIKELMMHIFSEVYENIYGKGRKEEDGDEERKPSIVL